MQYLLVRLLRSPSASLFVVGDPDQSIYSWRGAQVGESRERCERATEGLEWRAGWVAGSGSCLAWTVEGEEEAKPCLPFSGRARQLPASRLYPGPGTHHSLSHSSPSLPARQHAQLPSAGLSRHQDVHPADKLPVCSAAVGVKAADFQCASHPRNSTAVARYHGPILVLAPLPAALTAFIAERLHCHPTG